MSSKDHNKQAIRSTIRLYTQHIARNWYLTLPLSVICVVGTIMVFYVPPLIVADIIANASDTNIVSLQSGWYYVVLFGASWLIGELLWRLTFFLIQRYELIAFKDFYHMALEDLLQKDVAFFHDRFTGSLTKNTVGFARRFENFFDTLVFDVIASIFPAIFALIILAFISPILSLVLLGMMILGISIVRPLLKRRIKLVHIREDRHSELAGHISDVISNIAAVKAHGLEIEELSTHRHHVDRFVQAAFDSWNYHNTRIDMIVSPIYVLTNVFGLLIVLSLGVDNQTKAQLFLAFSYYSTFSRFLWSFNGVYRRLEESVTEAALFTNYLLVKPTITDAPKALPLDVTRGQIDFLKVAFTHGSDKVANLFDELNLRIEPGQKVGLVGHSGAGKSTLVSLLERFIDVDSGAILIDGQNIAEVSQVSLHKAISYVPQEPMLFHRSLEDNIAYGKPGATKQAVIAAAKKANAWEFIESLPDGLETLVGERGVKLSGGQRQRIAIARAILKDAPILLLDEATSALDSGSEKLIQASLNELMKGRTSIVIAHRLSTIAKLDRIIVLDDGKVIEDGMHAELLKQGGVYATLWAHQSGGFLDE